MPAKNVAREYDVPAYYHVYNRGAGKQLIFYDDTDRGKFLSILARHLDKHDEAVRADGVPYEKYDVELLAYCLMDNHFHLLLYQEYDIDGVTKLLKSVTTAYTMHFNQRHKSSGHLFQGSFKASKITNEAYLENISRYIHLNPRSYKTYKWSSIGIYRGKQKSNWVYPERILTKTPEQYMAFLADSPSLPHVRNSLHDQIVF